MNVHCTGQPITLGQNPLCTEKIIDELQQSVYQLEFQTRMSWWFGSTKQNSFGATKLPAHPEDGDGVITRNV